MPTSANIDVVLCKRKQQVTTLLGPTVLGVIGQQCCVRLHGPKKFDRFQTGHNKCQQVPTLMWFYANEKQQVTTLLGPTVLGVVGQQCCVRLHGPLESNFKIFSNEPLHKIDNITISLSGLVKFN